MAMSLCLATRAAAALRHAHARMLWPPFASGDGEVDGHLLVVNVLVLVLGFSQGRPAGLSVAAAVRHARGQAPTASSTMVQT